MLTKIFFNVKLYFAHESYLYNILKFGIVNGISKFFSFIIFIILAKHFNLENLGNFDYFIVFLTLMASISLLGLDSMIYRFLHDESIVITKTQLVSRTLFTQCIAIVIILVTLYLSFYSKHIPGMALKLSGSDFFFFALALIGMVFYTISEVILRISENLNKYILLVTLNSLLFLVCTFVSLNYFNIDFKLYLKFYTVIYFIIGTTSLFFIRQLISFKRIKIINYEYVLFSLPIGLLSLLPLIQGYFMRNFVFSFLDGYMLGSYSAGTRLTIFYTLPSFAVTNAIIPLLLRSKSDSKFSNLANKLLFFTILTLSFCLFMLTIFSKELFNIFLNQNNEASLTVFIYLCFGLFLQSISSILSLGSFIKNGTIYRFFSGYLVMIISIFLSFYLIKIYGLDGLIIGILTGNLLLFFLDFYIAQRVHKISWEISKLSIFLIISFCLFFVCQYLCSYSLLIRIPFSIFFILIPFFFTNFLLFKNYQSSKV
jgi:O-antigen/teichoic acid export membrane protein